MSQSALLLGSGFVATPTVEVLANAGVHVTVACRTLASAKKLAANFPNTSAISLDVNDSSALADAVSKHDVTISLIPYTYHVAVVKAAIKAKKHVVTTSYVSPAMQALDEEVKSAGITVLNEVGVGQKLTVLKAQNANESSLILGITSEHYDLSISDFLFCSIDHLYAVDLIDRVHKEGGSIRAFRSFCGGLPAPESMKTIIINVIINANYCVRLRQSARYILFDIIL